MIRHGRTVAIAALLGLCATAAAADEAAVKYRQAVMEAIGGHTAALAAIVTRDVPFTEDAPAHATAVGELAKMAGHIFPQGSDTGKTDALPAIWQKPEPFQKVLVGFQTAAARVAAAGGGADLPAALDAMLQTCKSCHDDFKKKD